MSNPGFTAIQRTDSSGQVRWVHFCGPEAVLEAKSPTEVTAVIAAAESARSKGMHAVGWIAYEAAPAFDPTLPTHAPMSGLPLARFSLYREQREGLPAHTPGSFSIGDWTDSLDAEEFADRVEAIRAAIAAGETYQVNFTSASRAPFSGDPWSLFRSLRAGQAARHMAYLDEGDRVVLCASPELFFRLEANRVVCRPMKGTAPPAGAETLATSRKDRAENVMIVDMIRNDLGKVARAGTVLTPSLFEVEAYPSLAQMTSVVEASGSAPASAWLAALFPCASITGAPKRQTMRWIQRLECGPRGVYTGTIGGFYADGTTEFNVAIRTAVLDRPRGELRYDTGCGIVWDSDPLAEHRESLLKARVIREPTPPFQLIETLRWEPGDGGARWLPHRERLLASANALGFAILPDKLDKAFAEQTHGLNTPARVRLLADMDGGLDWSISPLEPTPERWTFSVDNVATPSAHPGLRHKTTRRDLYTEARARHPEADEVLLINERGEAMEFTIGNLVVERDGERITPPLSCGMLPGTTRAMLVGTGWAREQTLRPEEVLAADRVWLVNAVRGRVPMVPLSSPETNRPMATAESAE